MCALGVHTWLLACPHLVSFIRPVPAFQEDVSYSLRSAPALALVGFGLVDRMKVGPEADFSRSHLCDHGAERPMRSVMCFERRLARSRSEPEEFPAVLC